MRLVLATGIFPPDIGGPATYVARLGAELQAGGHDVTVVTYGPGSSESLEAERGVARVVRVPRIGGQPVRWFRYASALRRSAADADIVYVTSAVSVGVPLTLSGLRRPPVRVLRLGGDFLWERATDAGDTRSLKEWYGAGPKGARVFGAILRRFDHLVFSTDLQRELYRHHYHGLSESSVIENALPGVGVAPAHEVHQPFRLLAASRLVAVKNLHSLVEAMVVLPQCTLTIIGEGPAEPGLRALLAAVPALADRVTLRPRVRPDEMPAIFRDHDLLVVPSFTEVSPNGALEARAAGLPVLLTQENGLSPALSSGMLLRDLRHPQAIADAVREVVANYAFLAHTASAPLTPRPWSTVAAEHVDLFSRLQR